MSHFHEAFEDFCSLLSKVNLEKVTHLSPTSPPVPYFNSIDELTYTYDYGSLRAFFEHLEAVGCCLPGSIPESCLAPRHRFDDYINVLDNHPKLAFIYLFLAPGQAYKKLKDTSFEPLLDPMQNQRYDLPEFDEILQNVFENTVGYRLRILATRAIVRHLPLMQHKDLLAEAVPMLIKKLEANPSFMPALVCLQDAIHSYWSCDELEKVAVECSTYLSF
jgi:hypothetical protein